MAARPNTQPDRPGKRKERVVLAVEHVERAAVVGLVPDSRLVSTTEGVQGGGDLTANRTLKLDVNGLTADATPDGAADYVATYDASTGLHKKVLLDDLPGGGGGEVNTGANVNTGGVGVFDGKVGVQLQFRGIKADNSTLSVTLDDVNNEIVLDIVEANVLLQNLGGAVTDGQIPASIARDSEVTTAISNHEAAADPHTGYQRESEKDAESGYCGLDANAKVDYARIQNVSATDRLLGRQTAGAGVVEEITCTAAGRAILDDATAGDQRTTLGLGALATKSTVATADIDNDAVTYAKIQNVTATDKVLGRSSVGAGDVEEIACTAAGRALLDDASAGDQRTTLGLGALATLSTVGTSQIDNDAVTNAKLANVATATIKGRVTAATGDPEDLTGTQATTLLDVFTDALKGLAPASGGGTTNFLRADGSWASPAGGGNVNAGANLTDNAIVRGDGGTTGVQTSGVTIDDTNHVAGMASLTLPNTGLHLLDTNASHDLIVAPGSDLSADRTLTITTGDASRTLTISADAVIGGTNSGDQFQSMTTDRLLGRDTAGAGAAEELTVGGGVEFTGSGGIQRSALTGDVTASAGSNATTLAANLKLGSIQVVLGNGTDTITTGVKGFLCVPFPCTLTGWDIVADASGSIVVDVWRDTYANFPPTVADTLITTSKPTLSSAQKAQDTDISSDWETSISAQDWLAFNVDSATTVKQVTLSIRYTRTA